jgi:hypothetical protein
MEAGLYLKVYSDPTQLHDGRVSVPLETLISLYILDYIQCPEVELHLVPFEADPNEGFQVKIRQKHRVTTLKETPVCVQNCMLPVVWLSSSSTCVAGLCAVLRQVVKCTLDEHPAHFSRKLLGFREGCLMACAEASTWTRFCEVDIILTTNQLIKVKFSLHQMIYLICHD